MVMLVWLCLEQRSWKLFPPLSTAKWPHKGQFTSRTIIVPFNSVRIICGMKTSQCMADVGQYRDMLLSFTLPCSQFYSFRTCSTRCDKDLANSENDRVSNPARSQNICRSFLPNIRKSRRRHFYRYRSNPASACSNSHIVAACSLTLHVESH